MKSSLKCSLLALLIFPGTIFAKSWFSQPIEVHEWGVNSYDWSGESKHAPQLPPFFYTDKKPGTPHRAPSKVKNLPPDSGIRYKPLLYFYPPHDRPIPIGVETRFA